ADWVAWTPVRSGRPAKTDLSSFSGRGRRAGSSAVGALTRWRGPEQESCALMKAYRTWGALMLDNLQSSAGIITNNSGNAVAETVDRLKRLIADRGFTVFNVIDHSGVAERVGVQMPDSKLVLFGKPTVDAAVMVAAPLAALDLPLKVLVWEDGNGAVSVS